jgi:hypothetical protein
MQVLAQVIADPIPWPLELRPDLPRELARGLMRALERDPERRFQSMSEFAAALAPFGPARNASVILAELQRSRGRLGEILVRDGLLSPTDWRGRSRRNVATGVCSGACSSTWASSATPTS